MSEPDHEALLAAGLAGRYRLEAEVGRGGMATVYRARDLRHQRNVAIKVMRPDLRAIIDPARFLREIRITSQLQHPNIPPLFDSGEVHGVLYYVMPFVEGESLAQRLERLGRLEDAEALALTRELCDALANAHRQASLILGAPAYMSPEQARGAATDHRADLYALGFVWKGWRPPVTDSGCVQQPSIEHRHAQGLSVRRDQRRVRQTAGAFPILRRAGQVVRGFQTADRTS